MNMRNGMLESVYTIFFDKKNLGRSKSSLLEELEEVKDLLGDKLTTEDYNKILALINTME